MMNRKPSCTIITTVFLSCLLFDLTIYAHGFASHTLIRSSDETGWWTIEQTAYLSTTRKKQSVTSYDTDNAVWTKKCVTGGAYAYANCYCRLSVDEDTGHDIICSPTQLFYRITDSAWVPTYELKVGDLLLAEHDNQLHVHNLSIVEDSLKLHTIQVEDTHTFLVGIYGIVAHNMLVPVSAIVGLSIPFGIECGGSLGTFFGPPGVIGGIVIGGLLGCVIKTCTTNQVREYQLIFDPTKIQTHILHNNSEDKNNSAQAPGKPTEKDGYIPPKRWNGEKVRHPKNNKVGWPDKKGNVWVPSGPNGHGGPHWDVQRPDGNYDNVLPGGKIRGEK